LPAPTLPPEPDPHAPSGPPPAGPGPDPQDPYARLQYRRLFAWPERIRREAPFLESVAARGPELSVLDLGCGTGEHARWFASRGYRVLGVDLSEAQLEVARDAEPVPGLRFASVDLTQIEAVVVDRFGTAVCLGNTLVHVLEQADLDAACRGVFSRLLDGGSWLVQVLNYERIFARGERVLPVNLQEQGGETLVFLRLLRPLGGGLVQFFPTTLRLRPDAEPPLEIVASRAVTLRGWTRSELEPALRRAGFTDITFHGDMQGGPFLPEASADLVLVARRTAP